MKLKNEPQDEIAQVAFAASCNILPEGFTFDDMKMQLGHWRLRGIFDAEKCIGAVMDHAGVVHVSVLPEARKKWASKELLKEAIHGAMINGKCSTLVFRDDRRRAEFAERLGFVKTDENELVERYDYVIH